MSTNASSPTAPAPATSSAAASSSASAKPASSPLFGFGSLPSATAAGPLTADQEAAMEEEEDEVDHAAEASAQAYASLLNSSSPEEKVVLGRKFLREGELDRAVDMLAIALEWHVARYGALSLRCALVYRCYGDAMLQHFQKNTGVLGPLLNADTDKRQKAMGDDDEDTDEPQADPADLTHAYECLETARVIYARHYKGEGLVQEVKADEDGARQAEEAAPAVTEDDSNLLTQKELGLALADTYEILANFFMEKEDFAGAASDYSKALNLLIPNVPPHSRDVAALHMQLAVCALFDSKPEIALESYKQATEVMRRTVTHLEEQIKKEEILPSPMPAPPVETPIIAAAASSSAAAASSVPAPVSVAPAAPLSVKQKYEAELADCKDILDELKERIDDITTQLALPAEDQALSLIKQQNLSGASPFSLQNQAAASSSNPFAQPAAAAASSNPFAMPGTASAAPAAAAASSSAAGAAAPAAAHTVGQKRKVKPTPVAGAAAAATKAANAAPVDRSADVDGAAAKRTK